MFLLLVAPLHPFLEPFILNIEAKGDLFQTDRTGRSSQNPPVTLPSLSIKAKILASCLRNLGTATTLSHLLWTQPLRLHSL